MRGQREINQFFFRFKSILIDEEKKIVSEIFSGKKVLKTINRNVRLFETVN